MTASLSRRRSRSGSLAQRSTTILRWRSSRSGPIASPGDAASPRTVAPTARGDQPWDGPPSTISSASGSSISRFSAARAASAWKPRAEIRTVAPALAPSRSSAARLLPLARLLPWRTITSASNPLAASTNAVAGRACRPCALPTFASTERPPSAPSESSEEAAASARGALSAAITSPGSPVTESRSTISSS